jgi:hypothetical protein
METAKRNVCENSGNDSLGPSGNESPKISSPTEVENQKPQESAGYIPTHKELVQLVKYWYRRRLEDMWFYFCYGQSGNDMSATLCCADFRISLAAKIIGWKVVHQAIAGVREEFRAEVKPRPAKDARLWDLFQNGTHEQWVTEQTAFWREYEAKQSRSALSCSADAKDKNE